MVLVMDWHVASQWILEKLVLLKLMKHSFTMLDYPALAAVAAVIREGSFERAAKALAITPSAISQRVRGMEERLGAILIVRGQPCEPTKLGRTLSAHFDRVRLLESDLAPALGGHEASTLTVPMAVNADSLATWFPAALAAFGRNTGATIALVVEDEAHTADRLRSGEVLAAVTADPVEVQGCKTLRLGTLRYAACASSDFVERHFAEGVNGASLQLAPTLRFDRRDMLQAQWAREAYGIVLAAPTHWAASSHAFLDLGLAGLGWAMHPVALAQAHIAKGRLIELPPALPVDVHLYWTVARLPSSLLRHLTEAVREAARQALSHG
ncbi:LysR family transcriptional regulator ArgP [Sphingomonas koreensis]